MDFKNKVVLITGGSRGIGKEIAMMFANRGAKVVFTYSKSAQSAKRTLELLQSGGHKAIRTDMTNPVELKLMVEEVIKAYDKIDVLVNNAGVFFEHPIHDLSYKEWQKAWDRTLSVNLSGLANLCYLVGREMITRKEGSIINISSRGAYRGEPEAPAYGASKAAVNSLSQSLAKSLGKYNISVTGVAPGFVETEMATKELLSERGDQIRGESPFNRVAKAEEVAEVVLFLAGNSTKFLSGGIIDVNGASYLR